MGFSRQEYWSGLPFPSPGDLPDPGIEPRSPALEAEALCRRHKRYRFDPGVGNIPWQGNGNPLQYSWLENAMDRGAWWASAHGVAKSQDSQTETEIAQRSENYSFSVSTCIYVKLWVFDLTPQFQHPPAPPCFLPLWQDSWMLYIIVLLPGT